MEEKIKIDKMIFSQYNKFNENNNTIKKNIESNFVDELMSAKILVYFKFNGDGLYLRDITKYENIDNEKIEWKIEDDIKIPYLDGKKILAIQFNKNNLDKINNFLS